MPLEKYREKRDFDATPEPVGGLPSAGALRFVVQQHHASRMHWDFRLEFDGVLMSWAVPKGPSLDPADKRLAVHVEDHPLDYADFEGVIPAGEYGGGTVIVWDRGTWEPMGDPAAGLAKGDFKFRLFGEKLRGGWVLVRLKPRGNEKGENWLLIKERDDEVRRSAEYDIVAMRPESVVSGRAVDDLREDVPAAPPSAPAGTGAQQPAPPSAPDQPAALAPPAALALCTLVTTPPVGDAWLSEVKYDGYRLTIALAGGVARCFSRAGNDVTSRFAALARAAAALPAESALLDGEAVVFDERGSTNFSSLQSALTSSPERIAYVAFDLLHLNGHDVTGLPTTARKDLLRDLLEAAPPAIRYAEHIEGDSPAFFEVACAQGLEGAVFKRADAAYPAGRTRSWLKAKCRLSQEFVVGGYTDPKGGRTAFGALLLGVHDADGKLRYAGRAGSGFTDSQLADTAALLKPLARATSPFTAVPPDVASRGAHWVTPRLVAQVAFAEWTPDGLLRQPSFLGFRDDVPVASVRREDALQLSETEPPAEKPADTSATSVLGVKISNPDKQLFPDTSLTKLDLARYYEAVAPHMLREIAERPLTLVRCPVGGGSGACFYQRHAERGLSSRIHTVAHALAGHEAAEEWLVVDSADGLVALAQMGVAEIHTWSSRSDGLTHPDRLVFDLDPGPSVAWERMVEAAHLLREELSELGFTPHLKSTGSKGLHVVVPIEPVWEFERIKALSRGIAERASVARPDLLTAKAAKAKRAGRIYIDYLRNAEGASAVAPYSTRHLEGASTAVPLAWEELEDTSLDIRAFTPAKVIERLEAGIDPWSDIEASSAGVRVLRAALPTLDV